jgi:type II secretory pathway component GspD/PulD (secretin)
LEVSPEASSQSGVATLASGSSSVSIPIVDTREAVTTVLIKSGNTLAIGGLMRQDVSDKYTKVPIMGDLPGIGAMFRSKSLTKTKRDLLIFLTPTIIAADAQTGYERHINGILPEELYTNDKFLPNDNAKPNVGGLKGLIPFQKQSTQNFGSK